MRLRWPFTRSPRPSAPIVPEGLSRLLTLDEIKRCVDRLAARLPGPRSANLLPSYGETRDFGYPHIECDTAYHWVVVERGNENERRTTSDLNELLYWVFQSVTSTLAGYHASRRRPRDEYRRGLFRSQLKLLARLDPKWSERRRNEIIAVLAEHPFTDGGPASLD